jgi:hypothetical protein
MPEQAFEVEGNEVQSKVIFMKTRVNLIILLMLFNIIDAQ